MKHGKTNKRAVYICRNRSCLENILKYRSIVNFLKPITKEAEIKLVSDSFRDAVKKLGGI